MNLGGGDLCTTRNHTKPEEFINHEEVLASINYAEENKNNLELIDKNFRKSKTRKRA